MRCVFKSMVCMSEPHPMDCPVCGTRMIWIERIGKWGGWRCPNCHHEQHKH